MQSRAASLEAELSAVRQLEGVITTIRTLKRRFPKLVDEFNRQLHAAVDDEISEQEIETIIPKAGEQEFGVEQLVAFLRSRNNEPASIHEMAEAIGKSDRTVKGIIYQRHPGKFVTSTKRGKNNRAYFCLAEA